MIKIFLSLLLLLFAHGPSFAITDADVEAALKKEYGNDLTHVPFFLRFNYYNKYHKDWKYTYYIERKEFLKNYETELAAEKKKQETEAKAQAQKDKEELREKKEKERTEQARLKARLDKEKAQAREDADRQRDFDAALKDQHKAIDEMRRNFNLQSQNR